MDFDVKAFTQQLIQKVEDLANGEGNAANNKKIDTDKERSIFTQEFNNVKASLSEADANAVWMEAMGVELSGTTPKNAPRRAAGEGGDGQPIVIIVEKGGSVVINIDNSTNWQLNINIDANLEGLVNKLIAAFKENTDLINNNNNQLVKDLKAFFLEQNQNQKNDVEKIFSFLAQIYNVLRNDGDLAIDALTEIISSLKNLGVVIEGAAEMINDTLKNQYDTVVMMLRKFDVKTDTLISLIEKNNESQDDQNEILSLILDGIKNINGSLSSLSTQQKQQLAAILNMLEVSDEHQQEAYQTVIALLDGIRNDNSENKEISKAILKAVQEGNTVLAEKLSEISVKFTSYGDEVKALLADVISHIDNISPGDLTALLDRLDKILVKLDDIDTNTSQTAENTAEINETNKKILAFVEKYGADVLAKFDSLIKLGEENNQYQAEIKNLINQIIQNGVNLNIPKEDLQAIIKAINNVAEKVSKGSQQLDTKLGTIIELLTTANTQMGVIIGMDGEEGYIQKIDKALAQIIELMGKDPETGESYTELLNKILNALGGEGANINQTLVDNFTTIITALGQKAENGEDGSGILGLLQQILAAIKDCEHKVLITIKDENGNIIFQSPHEGSQGDLGLGVKAYEFTLGEDDADPINNVEADETEGKKFAKDGKIFIKGDDGHIYDTLGRLIK